MGKKAGDYFKGTDIFYPSCLDLNKDALEILTNDGCEDLLPEDAIVFAMHQGFQFHFF